MVAEEEVLRNVVSDELTRIERMLLVSDMSTVEILQIRIERLYGHLLYIHGNCLAPSVVSEEFLEKLRSLLHLITTLSEDILNETGDHCHIPLIESRGRPKYDLPRKQLLYFIEHGFTCSRISAMLQISQRTIRRQMSSYGLSVQEMYSQISDAELKKLITEAHVSFPNAGYRFIRGWLNQRGFKIQEYRVRELMREVDPIGVTNRFFQSIHRRTYSVKAGSQYDVRRR